MLVAVPDFVKNATEQAIRGDETLVPAQWADPANRRYPVHTPAAVWVSAKEADENGVTDVHIRRKIATAAALFRVEVPHRQHAEFNPLTQTNPLFALVVGHGDKTARLMPLDSEADVRAAGPYLMKHARTIVYEHRQTAAENILKEADSRQIRLEPSVHEWLHLQAGRGETTVETVKNAFVARAVLCPPHAAELRQAAESIEPNMTQDQRIKIAGLLSEFDTANGLAHRYDDNLLSPERALFGVTHRVIKQAAANHIQMTNGAIFEKAALRQIPEMALRTWLGGDLVDSMSGTLGLDQEKLAETLPILPRPDADRFVDCAKASGITPVEAAAA